MFRFELNMYFVILLVYGVVAPAAERAHQRSLTHPEIAERPTHRPPGALPLRYRRHQDLVSNIADNLLRTNIF